MRDRELEQLASRVRDKYIECRRQHASQTGGRASAYRPGKAWDGGRTASGQRRQSIWEKIAAHIRTKDYDLDTYIQAQFHRCQAGYPPKPNVLLSPVAASHYLLYLREREPDYRQTLANQVQAYAHALYVAAKLFSEPDAAVRYVLSDPAPSLTPLFRYCAAAREGLEDQVRFWYVAALKQYKPYAANYDQYWGELIPDTLRRSLSHL